MMTRAKATKRLLEHHPVNLELARVKVDEADDIIARLIKNHIAALDRRGGGCLTKADNCYACQQYEELDRVLLTALAIRAKELRSPCGV